MVGLFVFNPKSFSRVISGTGLNFIFVDIFWLFLYKVFYNFSHTVNRKVM